MPFVKLDRNCNTCHSGWDPGTFDHAVTRQRLDETHAEIGCQDGHVGRQFDAPPKCDECHEEEGIVSPAKPPGPLTGAGKQQAG